MDQYIANADGQIDLQNFWRELKQQEQENVDELKKLVAEHCAKHCF
ncbi:MAG: hypothetical protein ACREH8_02525 [Opitutaceae bacterium]